MFFLPKNLKNYTNKKTKILEKKKVKKNLKKGQIFQLLGRKKNLPYS